MRDHPRATWLDPTSGEHLDERALLAEMATRQVVLLGETHTVAEIHRWQLHVATVLRFLRPNIAVGFEMFPRRVQAVLDEWVDGELGTDAFLDKVEWGTVWGFDAQLYLPLFHFCRQHRVKMLALNCHRPLVTRVGKEGWDAIPENERDGLTPSAEATPAYRQYLANLGLGRGPVADGAAAPPSSATDRFVRAQQTWDRAFACSIARALQQPEPEPPLVIGIIGRGHLEYGHGTPYQLADLGVTSTGVLLPTTSAQIDVSHASGISDAVFRLDEPDPEAPMPAKMLKAIEEHKARVAAEAKVELQ
ncbi:ChaN family lipoprotein [Tardiphaga sp. 42S5]|uniref:ChaN family lipoprotein n=1 Tax=Tardiphaga sp. 42S5 TaxID=1404799 RepID=UPI002A5A4F77|nr:ChaN family lipoprotein [Tardiphaga sp. 42S5]WPO39623.1 ChaN family lipoprotein [Tardiphaga sp. 42S5]